MTRTIGANMKTDLAALSGSAIVSFIEFQYSTTTRITTAPHDVDWNSQTWTGIGGSIAIEPVGESLDIRGQGVNLEVSGVDQAILAIILGEVTRGRLAILWYAHFDEALGTVITDPIEIFRGYMNEPWEVAETKPIEGRGTVKISTRLVSRLATARARRGLLTNLESHKAAYTGDTFFQNLPGIVDKEIFWARLPERVGAGDRDRRAGRQ